jgi:beta-N-acetylhexosaminidase
MVYRLKKLPTLRSFFFGILWVGFLMLMACDRKSGSPPEQTDQKVLVKEEVPAAPAPDTVAYPSPMIKAFNTASPWVDSVFSTLTLDERIAQLMIVEAFSNRGKAYEEDLLLLINRYKVGGLIFFQGGPARQAILTNKLQAASKVPLLVSMDAESGVGMRLDSTVRYPLQMPLGALADDSLIYQMGAEIAEEFKRLGMHLNFAPVADINNNPANPIISYRAFGENRDKVTAKSLAYMRGMQDHGIIATAKHFPGHGDTDVDSHLDLPLIPHGRSRLDSLELHPFRELIRHGIGGIMVAHMDIPDLDPAVDVPSTLSKPIVTGLLKEELGFHGLIVTDAMVMKGVTKFYKPGEAEVQALVAGNDVLERMVSVPRAIEQIKAAIRRGEISRADIDRRCKKVLAAKQWVGLDRYRPIDLNNLIADLNRPRAEDIRQKLAEASVTLLQNRKKIIPVRQSWRLKIATVALGADQKTPFQQVLGQHYRADHYVLPKRSKKSTVEALRKKLRRYDRIIVGIHGPSIRPSNNLGFSGEEAGLVRELAQSGKAIITLFDNAYALTQFKGIEKANGLIVAYQQIAPNQEAAARIIAGQLKPAGHLPVTVSRDFTYGDGL